MLKSTNDILQQAQKGCYAIGAFNVYTVEGVRAVVSAAEKTLSPAIIQLLPKALEIGGVALIAMCLEAVQAAKVPMSVHLDHCSSLKVIESALAAGISSTMADGSHLPFEQNLAFTRQIADLARSKGKTVEAELGRIAGSEDGITVAERQARLTDPIQAATFVEATHIHALAVCIGNVHGKYHAPPELDFDRLAAIANHVSIPLVLHGTSGLPDEMIRRAVSLGVCKFNVNTELRDTCLAAGGAYLSKSDKPELVERMQIEIEAMMQPVSDKITLFGSAGMAF